MGDLVVATVVATWTCWVDLKVAARSRSRSLTRWFDLGVGCSHDGQINPVVGCSWRSDWLRGGLFTGSRTHDGLIYFPVAPALSVLHCKCSPLLSPAWRGNTVELLGKVWGGPRIGVRVWSGALSFSLSLVHGVELR